MTSYQKGKIKLLLLSNILNAPKQGNGYIFFSTMQQNFRFNVFLIPLIDIAREAMLNFAAMLTEKELQFIEYWEKNREIEATFSSKLLKGLPMSMFFSLPIILSVIVVRLFFPEWYAKMSSTSSGMFLTVIIAVFVIAIFYAVFRMHFKWEHNEEIYQRLKSKKVSNNKK